MVASHNEIRNIKRIILRHLSLQRARRMIGEMVEKVGHYTNNESLKKTLRSLKKELMVYHE